MVWLLSGFGSRNQSESTEWEVATATGPPDFRIGFEDQRPPGASLLAVRPEVGENGRLGVR